MVQHPNYDQFWTSRALGPDMRHLTAPVLLVGGWFDAEDLGGTLKLFRAIGAEGSAPALTLVMGPWSHGGWGGGEGETIGQPELWLQNRGIFPRANRGAVFSCSALKGQVRISRAPGGATAQSLDVRNGQERMARIRGLAPERRHPPFAISSGRWKAFLFLSRQRRRRNSTNTSATRPNRCR